MEYGPQYDAALHVLLWELLSKLEKLLPVPDLKQVRGSVQLSQVDFLLQRNVSVITNCDYRRRLGSARLLLWWRNAFSRHLKS